MKKTLILLIAIILGSIINAFPQGNNFKLGGNNNVGINDWLGTTNLASLTFATNNTAWMWLSPTGNLGLGVSSPTHKFEVLGNSKFDGNVDITGTLNFNGTGGMQMASIVVPLIKTGRITALDGDSVIRIGDSSLVFSSSLPDRMWSDNPNYGIGIGVASVGYGKYSVAIGRNVITNGQNSYGLGTSVGAGATGSIVIGSGFDLYHYLANNKLNSIMLGTNSTVPTLFISPAPGPANNTIGNVGIGTTDPKEKLQIGNCFVFHDGGSKVIARNFYWDNNTSQSKRIEQGKSTAIYFGINGDISFKTAINGTADSPISWKDGIFITNDGFVGIGTDNPQKKLHLYSATQSSPECGTSLRLEYKFTGPNPNGCSTSSIWDITASGEVGELFFTPNNSPNPVMAVLPNGNVGIGMINPLYKLAVEGTASITDKTNIGIMSTSPTEKDYNAKCNISANSNDCGLFVRNNNSNATSYGIFCWMDDDNSVALAVGKGDIYGHGGNTFTVTGYGNMYAQGTAHIGGKTTIGHTNTNPAFSTAMLTVSGLIVATEVKIALTGFPDYVFDSKYKLPTLPEVEKYIEQNKHLPDVPSAADVEKNGVALGEMNKILLQKVEELTLYMINLQKENEALKDRMTKLEKK